MIRIGAPVETPPTLPEWRLLHDAMLKLKELAPWTWMWDSDDFGVRDPESGTIGYCAVMGRLGEHFALGVYLGTQGLLGLLDLRGRKKVPDRVAFLRSQLLLIASFENRADLEPQDLKVLKELGLKFRGSNEWPLLRSYRPGYLPWFLTGAEARFLTIAIDQTMTVALRFRKDPALLEPPRQNQFLVRVPRPKGAGLEWSDQWLTPELPASAGELQPPFPGRQVDPALMERATNVLKKRGGTWEIDVFPLSGVIDERGKRPYFPLTFQTMDHDTGLALHVHITHPDSAVREFREHFVKTIETLGAMPDTILVADARTYALLAPFAEALEIELKAVKNLPEMRKFQKGMEKLFEQGPPGPFTLG